MEPSLIQRNYGWTVLAYHGLPVLTAIVLVAAFIVTFRLTGSYPLSGVVAAVPSFLMLWRWNVSAKRVDRWLERWRCPNCTKPLPKKIYWSYPPQICPHCSERIALSKEMTA
jgi:hypothetical protein